MSPRIRDVYIPPQSIRRLLQGQADRVVGKRDRQAALSLGSFWDASLGKHVELDAVVK